MKTLILILITSFVLLGFSIGFSQQTSNEVFPQRVDSETISVELKNDIEKNTSAEINGSKDNKMIAKEGNTHSEPDSKVESAESKRRRLGLSLFKFGGSEPSWYSVDDNVMGGVSSSTVNVDGDLDQLTFSGTVSLENNGGFASTRSDWARYDLRGYDGIVLRVLGDGNSYRFRIRTAKAGPEVAYTALFETKAHEWHEVYIPFADMIPTYRGFVVNTAGPIDLSEIRSFGFMLTDKQAGEFSLTIDWINSVRVQNYQYSYASLGVDNPQINNQESINI